MQQPLTSVPLSTPFQTPVLRPADSPTASPSASPIFAEDAISRTPVHYGSPFAVKTAAWGSATPSKTLQATCDEEIVIILHDTSRPIIMSSLATQLTKDKIFARYISWGFSILMYDSTEILQWLFKGKANGRSLGLVAYDGTPV